MNQSVSIQTRYHFTVRLTLEIEPAAPTGVSDRGIVYRHDCDNAAMDEAGRREPEARALLAAAMKKKKIDTTSFPVDYRIEHDHAAFALVAVYTSSHVKNA